jgi:hypothetical protein
MLSSNTTSQKTGADQATVLAKALVGSVLDDLDHARKLPSAGSAALVRAALMPVLNDQRIRDALSEEEFIDLSKNLDLTAWVLARVAEIAANSVRIAEEHGATLRDQLDVFDGPSELGSMV